MRCKNCGIEYENIHECLMRKCKICGKISYGKTCWDCHAKKHRRYKKAIINKI